MCVSTSMVKLLETSKSWDHLSTERLGVEGCAEVVYWSVHDPVLSGKLWVGEGQTSQGGGWGI